MRIFDSDNHYYEPYDAFTRHIEAKFADKAIRVGPGKGGRQIVMCGDEPLKALPAHPQDFVNAPGSLHEMFKSGVADDTSLKQWRMRGGDNPAFFDRAARLRFMDEEGVDGCMLYPSLGVMVEQQLSHDVPATYANLRAFNRWLEDDWGYCRDGRIYAAPMLSLIDLDEAVTEVDRVLAEGARAVHIRPGPVAGRSPADPYFDPFWSRLDEARVPVAMHASFPNYHELVSSLWGEDADPTYKEITPFQEFLGMGERPIVDMLAALVFHGLFTRFRNVHVVSVESGSGWVAHLMEHMDHCALLAARSSRAPKLHDVPSAILAEHLYVSPHPEDDLPALAEVIPVERIVFGSDYPHAEGLAHPADFIPKAGVLGADAAARIMGENGASLVGGVVTEQGGDAEPGILYAVEDGIATITFNRPEKLNAITREIGRRYFELLQQAEDADDVRVVLLTGAGRAFCAGADTSRLNDPPPTAAGTASAPALPLDLPARMTKPMIAAINGAAAGAGLVYALSCDVRFAASDAVMTFAFSRFGLVAEFDVSWLLPRLVGTGRALDLLWTSRRFSGHDAKEYGMVEYVSQPGDTLREARAYAEQLSTIPVSSLVAMKQQVYANWNRTRQEALRDALGMMRAPSPADAEPRRDRG